MKHYKIQTFILVTFLLFAVSCNQQSDKQSSNTSKLEKKSVAVEAVSTKITAEVGCGECLFDLEGVGCDLAVRIDGKAYFVDGVGIDDLGDAHADDGLCNAIRKGSVEGYLKDDRFIAQNITLLPLDSK